MDLSVNPSIPERPHRQTASWRTRSSQNTYWQSINQGFVIIKNNNIWTSYRVQSYRLLKSERIWHNHDCPCEEGISQKSNLESMGNSGRTGQIHSLDGRSRSQDIHNPERWDEIRCWKKPIWSPIWSLPKGRLESHVGKGSLVFLAYVLQNPNTALSPCGNHTHSEAWWR